MTAHDPKIVNALNRLEQELSDILAENAGETKFWNDFTERSEPVLASADEHDRGYARGRIDCMLKNAGKIPGEDEGERCK